jgi:putative oxidoreductase
MNVLERFGHWGDAHHPKYMDVVRIVLGVFLCYRGVEFLRNMGILEGLLANRLSFGSFAILMWGHYIVFAHIVGGLLLIMGVLTRFACLIQIPILLGAVFLVNFSEGMFRPYAEIILSIVVLLLLCYFLVAGNGPWAIHLPTDEEQRVRH